jgi:uncharacterized repeat protein (TIGR02543 family)
MKHNNIFGDFIKRTAVMLSVMLLTAATAWAETKPIMGIELCEPGPGYIHVKGWTYDPNEPEFSPNVGVYDLESPSTRFYVLRTDIERNDVADLQGIPGNHGFDGYIPMNMGDHRIEFNVYSRITGSKTSFVTDAINVPAPLTGTVTLTSQSEMITLGDGATLTGTGGKNTRVTIASNATVTLSGVNISAIPDDDYHLWAGITCLGNATIVLAEGTNNYVKGGEDNYPGIMVGPPGTTLTIKGSGSLTATNSSETHFAAGIGSMFNNNKQYAPCGNIVIEDGNITAYGGNAPAIGGSCSSPFGNITITGGVVNVQNNGNSPCLGAYWTTCGNITITGGTVNATSSKGPAIGSGQKGTCGNITITGGNITAQGNAVYTIGPGSTECSCGTITIGGTIVEGITAKRFVYNSETTVCYVSFNKNANNATGTMEDELFFSTTAQPLNTCTYSLTGYGCKGWNTEADGSGTSYDCGQTINVTKNMTLFAQWGIAYTVTFNANKGSGTMAAQSYTENISQNLAANTFTRAGYDFAGWNTQADGNGTSYRDRDAIAIASNMTLYAQWQLHTYTINYNLDGGTNNSSNPSTYTIESDAITLAEPTRLGFVFEGWTWDGQNEPTKKVTIQHGSYGNITYTAHWSFTQEAKITPETGYTMLYDGHTLTGTGGTNTHVVIKDGATVTLSNVIINDITNDGYHMWSGITCEGDATIILADGTTNNLKGGCSSYPGILVPENKTITIQGSGTLYLSSSGYGPGIGTNDYGGGYGNIIIKGGTIIATGSMKYPGIGGIYGSYSGNITITDGVTSVTAIAGEEAPYSIGSGSGTVTIGGIETGNISFTPFTYKPSESVNCTVTFDANGGQGSMEQQHRISNIPQALTANTFSRDDYGFNGWNTEPDGTGTSYSDGQISTLDGDITLYAQWRKICTITFLSNGGEGSMDNQTCIEGIPQRLNACSYSYNGHFFAKWNTQADGSGDSYSDTQDITVDNDLTLYAQWRDPILAYITFNPNQGVGTMERQLYKEGESCLDLCTFEREDYLFKEWNTAADGSGTAYQDGQSIPISGDMTLYAQWTYAHTIITVSYNTTSVLLTNNDMLTGNCRLCVYIADGAKVRLKDVAINGNHDNLAGIMCNGDATIILEGSNTITGAPYYPAIHIPEGKTLTIKGNGSLIADGGAQAAGIGGGRNLNCGNIIIAGGTITATGGSSSPGIGSGNNSSCGNITITQDVTKVIATGGGKQCIGKGNVLSSSVGTISIASNLYDTGERGVNGSTRTITQYVYVDLAESNDNSTTILDNDGNICWVTLAGRKFYKDNSWNTLCLPFSISSERLTSSPLADAIIKELDINNSNLTDGMLTLQFKDATSIEAGKPYIVKWNVTEESNNNVSNLTITTTDEWNTFAQNVADGTTYQNKKIVLDADISVSTMVGGTFKGTFDGAGHTINVNLDGTGNGTALFHTIEEATIQNVKVEGTVKTTGTRPATFAAYVNGNSTIKNCWSNADISSSYESNSSLNISVCAGAFVGEATTTSGTIKMSDCLFTGTISYEATATSGGGMVGRANIINNSISLTNCLFWPSKLTIVNASSKDYVFISVVGIYNNNIALTNCYYNDIAKESVLNKDGTDATNMSMSDLLTSLGTDWEAGTDCVVPKMESTTPIVNGLLFDAVWIDASASTSVDFYGGSFMGTYSPVGVTVNDKSNLFLGAENKLFYPNGANNTDGKYYIKSCRAYFHIDGSSQVKEIMINFGDEEADGIGSMNNEQLIINNEAGAVYNLSGQKLSKPQKGINIINGKKLFVK